MTAGPPGHGARPRSRPGVAVSPLDRRLTAEFVGTALLSAIVRATA